MVEEPSGQVMEAGWYLLRSQYPPGDLRLAVLSGYDRDQHRMERKVRVPFNVADASASGGGSVVLLTRATRGLRLLAGEGSVLDNAPRLLPIRRSEAVRRMVAGLRDSRGRGPLRAWPGIAWRMVASLFGRRRGGVVAVLSSAYFGAGRRTVPCRVGAGIPRTAALDPLEQLVPAEAGPASWATTGEDPKFLLVQGGAPLPLPAGWYLFRARVQRHEGQVSGPCLYPDYGEAARQDDAIPLPAMGADGWIRSLVLLKHPVETLRFDPTIRQALFSIDGVSLLRIGRLRALGTMLAVRGDGGRVDVAASVDALRRFAADARSEGVSPATVRQFQRYLRAQRESDQDYRTWVRRFDTFDEAGRAMLARRAGQLAGGPRFSILLPVYETPEPWLRRCLDSVLGQAWPHWELCIADDASPSPHVQRVLAEYAARDARIRIVRRAENGHISAASNTALAMAQGEYVALLDHDDELRPHALLEMAEAIAADPALDLLYSDEDKIDEQGRRFDPYFKPDWDPELLLGQNYVCHLSVLRTARVREVGGFREGFEGSQDHDLILRFGEGLDPRRVHHVPRVLYHWRAIPGSTALERDAKDYAGDAGRRAVADHLARIAPGALVEPLANHHLRVRWPLPSPSPRVSLVIPTRDRAGLLRTCIESILGKTRYDDYDILVVNNGSTEADALSYLASLRGRDRVAVLDYDAPFNYSAINNWAVAQASGEVIGLVNNDIEVITPDWLEELVARAVRPGVGAVGPMLHYPDGRIQHAGVILGLGGIANHPYTGEPPGIGGHGGRLRVAQTMSAVTGACLVVRRDHYERIGGLDERLQVAFNDIDFCLRLRALGLRNVWTPFAELVHHESATRGRDEDGERRQRFLAEIAFMEARWGEALQRDPAYNPNLSLSGRGFELADPPRA